MPSLRFGWLGAGYTFIGQLQPIGRIGFIDPDLDAEGTRVRHYELGVSWLFQKFEARVTAAFGHFVPAPSQPKRNEGTLAAQVSF